MFFRVLLFVLLVAPSAAAAQRTGAVSGTVLDSASGALLAGATIRVEQASQGAISDDQGRFQLDGVAAGSRTLQVQRHGYRTQRQEVVIESDTSMSVRILLVEAATVLAPMTIIASRTRQELVRDLPVSIGIVGRDELAQMRPSHVSQPLNRIAGVHLTQFEGGGSYPSIRQPTCCRFTLSFMEDGIPFTSPAFYSPNYVGLVNYAQAGQVEVLRGPGTAVYGSDAVTGVINFVTEPAPLTPEGSVALEAGAVGYKRVLASAGGTFGGHNVSLGMYASGAEGHRENPYSTFGSTVRWQTTLGDGASLQSLVSVNTRDATGADDQTPQQFAERSSFNPYPVAFDNWRTVRASMTYRRESSGTSWSITPFARYEDSDRVPGWQLSYDPVVWQIDSRSLGMLSQVRHDIGGALRARITGGVDLDVTPGHRREPVITPVEQDGIWRDYSLSAVEPHYDYRILYRGAATYAQLEFEPHPKLHVTAGGRFDAAHYRYTNQLGVETTGAFRRPADTTLSYNGFSPKLGVVFAPGLHHRLFASYRRGFRVPIEQQLFKQGASANTTGLRPVQVSSVEAGARTRVAERVALEVVAYAMHLDNDILTVRDPAGIASLTNNGRTTHRGLEALANASLTRTLRFDVALTHAVHRFDRWVPSSTLDYSGNDMEAAPRTLRNAVLTWQPSVLAGGQVQLEYQGSGAYWIDGANTLRQPGWDIVHLRAGWVIARRWEVYARLMNVTDELYPAQAFPGFGPVERVMNPGEYRALYGGIKARF